MDKSVYVVSALRSPIGSFNGALSNLDAADLGVAVTKAALESCNCPPKDVEQVIFGQVLSAGQGQNPVRKMSVKVGVPVTSPAFGVNMLCGSGLLAVIMAAKTIKYEDFDVVVAGGMESMSNSPHTRGLRKPVKFGSVEFTDTVLTDGLTCSIKNVHMGVTAEEVAKTVDVSREDQDAFALLSQQRCDSAQQMGYFKGEIVPISVPNGRSGSVVVDTDEFPKPGTTIEGLKRLRSCFMDGGTVTAGNSSGINDGAAAVVLMSGEQVKERGLSPMGEIISYAYVGVEPMLMGLGPVPAVRKALSNAGWSLGDVDLFELNEAFSAQSVAVVRELGMDMSKVNVCGGAISLGHPIGASGARILVTLLHNMARLNVRKGIAALCVGGGMGVAVCVER